MSRRTLTNAHFRYEADTRTAKMPRSSGKHEIRVTPKRRALRVGPEYMAKLNSPEVEAFSRECVTRTGPTKREKSRRGESFPLRSRVLRSQRCLVSGGSLCFVFGNGTPQFSGTVLVSRA
jgi:hypothetical protein